MTLWRYVGWRYLSALFRVMTVITLIMLLVEAMENFRKHGEDTNSYEDVLELTVLRLPWILLETLPLVVLLATLVLVTGLARSSEMVVIRASGLSALRFLFLPFLLTLALGLAAIMILNPLVATTTRGYEVLSAQLQDNSQTRVSVSNEGIWLRQVTDDGHAVIQAERALSDGTTLFNASIHVFDQTGTLTERILARRAALKTNEWVLDEVRAWAIMPDRTNPTSGQSFSDSRRFATNLTANQILDSFAAPESVSVWDLPAFIDQLERSGLTATRHKQAFQTTLAIPLLLSAMLLIGAAATMRHVRFGNIGTIMLLTVMAGFALYFLKDFAQSLGAAGEIPTIIAAWAPPMAAAMAATGLLLHLEDG